jgi:hypothetical protein
MKTWTPFFKFSCFTARFQVTNEKRVSWAPVHNTTVPGMKQSWKVADFGVHSHSKCVLRAIQCVPTITLDHSCSNVATRMTEAQGCPGQTCHWRILLTGSIPHPHCLTYFNIIFPLTSNHTNGFFLSRVTATFHRLMRFKACTVLVYISVFRAARCHCGKRHGEHHWKGLLWNTSPRISQRDRGSVPL